MPTYRTPGVYVKEIDKVPSQIAQVKTELPVFIGYTEKAIDDDISILNRPHKISSFSEYERCFGSFPCAQFDWSQSGDNDSFELNIGSQVYYMRQVTQQFHLYKSIKLFFQNGGSHCIVVSVGNYQDVINRDTLIAGIRLIAKTPTAALLVIPESVSLPLPDCRDVQQAQIEYCTKAQHLVTILDINEQSSVADTADYFRQSLTIESRSSFAAAYMPYLNTMAIPIKGISLSNFAKSTRKQLSNILLNTSTSSNAELVNLIKAIANPEKSRYKDADIHKTLYSSSSAYRYLIAALHETINIVPPSGAVVGAIVQTDISRGVWKAPANVNLSGVVSPTLTINDQQQSILNVDQSGISINALRTFVGSGTLIWGARTLDGNSNEYRYVNVRRTLIMIEQSVLNALTSFVFEPNDANTWRSIQGMIENYLMTLWRSGGLAGRTHSEAYSVNIGLGSTMTASDIENGLLNLDMHIAMMRPAEFIPIRISQKMKT